MSITTECFICTKHSNLTEFTGEIIAERGGVMLTHFPLIEGALPTRGHLLIETRRHITDPAELNEEEAAAIGVLICEGARRIKRHLFAEHVYVFRINDKVPHLHFHLIPRYVATPKEFWGLKIMEWQDSPKATLEEVKRISKKLSAI